jgi:two-component system KDP operon response regulator KdpE
MGNVSTTSPTARPRVLLVLGNALANLVSLTLGHQGYETRIDIDAKKLPGVLQTWNPHLAFLDLDHYRELIDPLVSRSVPVLAFTRHRDTSVKLKAFARGVEDMIEAPFTLDEIIARPYVLMRRIHRIDVPLVAKIQVGAIEVDLVEQRVHLDGKNLELTPIQQTMLFLLAANTGRVLTRQHIITDIWGSDFALESNVVDRHIRELRVKLGDEWRRARYIETVAGEGYRFVGTEDAAAD